MDQNLSLYKVFYTVANAGNISKAAAELFISQPAISKSIVFQKFPGRPAYRRRRGSL